MRRNESGKVELFAILFLMAGSFFAGVVTSQCVKDLAHQFVGIFKMDQDGGGANPPPLPPPDLSVRDSIRQVMLYSWFSEKVLGERLTEIVREVSQNQRWISLEKANNPLDPEIVKSLEAKLDGLNADLKKVNDGIQVCKNLSSTCRRCLDEFERKGSIQDDKTLQSLFADLKKGNAELDIEMKVNERLKGDEFNWDEVMAATKG